MLQTPNMTGATLIVKSWQRSISDVRVSQFPYEYGAIVLLGHEPSAEAEAFFFTAVLRIYVTARGLGWVRSGPFQMKTGPDLPGREPDVLFLQRDHLDRLRGTYLDGPADLVVEIVSPESVGRDRGDKFYEYAQGGMREYWLIDPQIEWADFYRLEGERYRPAFSGERGTYHAAVLPDFWTRVEWLWQDPLPSPIRAVAEIAGVDPALVDAFERALRGEQGE